MQVAGSLIFALLGLLLASNGIGNLVGRKTALAAIPVDQQAMVVKVMTRSALFAVIAGLSFLIASVLVWIRWPVAVAFASWPIVLFGFFWATGGVDVISKMSSGDC